MRFHRPQCIGRTAGFTLIELIIYLGMVAFVLVAATQFAFELAITSAKTAALEETSRNARFAVARIAAEIREASDVNLGSSTLGVNPSTLSLATANGATNPTIFSVSGTTLNIQQGAGPALPLTNSKVQVVDFTVTNLSTTGRTKAFRIALRLVFTNPTSLQQFAADYTFETTAKIQKADGFSN